MCVRGGPCVLRAQRSMLRRFTIYYYARSPKNTSTLAPTPTLTLTLTGGHMAHNNGLSCTIATQLTQLRKISRLDQYPVTSGWPSNSPTPHKPPSKGPASAV